MKATTPSITCNNQTKQTNKQTHTHKKKTTTKPIKQTQTATKQPNNQTNQTRPKNNSQVEVYHALVVEIGSPTNHAMHCTSMLIGRGQRPQTHNVSHSLSVWLICPYSQKHCEQKKDQRNSVTCESSPYSYKARVQLCCFLLANHWVVDLDHSCANAQSGG